MHRIFLWFDRKIAFEPVIRAPRRHFFRYRFLSMDYAMFLCHPIYNHNYDSNRHQHKQIHMVCFDFYAIADRIHEYAHIHLGSIPAKYTNWYFERIVADLPNSRPNHSIYMLRTPDLSIHAHEFHHRSRLLCCGDFHSKLCIVELVRNCEISGR